MTEKQQHHADQIAAIEIQPPQQPPTLLKLEAILGITPDIWWDQPAVRLHMTNGGKHRLAFANHQARDEFYSEVCAHFSISRHQVVEMQSEEV